MIEWEFVWIAIELPQRPGIPGEFVVRSLRMEEIFYLDVISFFKHVRITP